MPLSQRLFRASALEQLSTPEQLDRLLHITSPRGWIALAAIWALLAVIVVWAFFGEVPTKEEGHGILIAGGGLKLVVAPGDGLLEEIAVEVGDAVKRDQVVAVIDQSALADEIASAKERLEELRRKDGELTGLDQKEHELDQKLADVERERWKRKLAIAKQRKARHERTRATVVRAIADGAAMERELDPIDADIELADIDVDEALHRIEQAGSRLEKADSQRERDIKQRAFDIGELVRRIDLLERRYDDKSNLRSPAGGHVVEIRAAADTEVESGDTILVIQPTTAASGELEAILYVSAATGKTIEVGDEVQVSPSTVKREEFGSMKGVVRTIADVPTSRSAMLTVLGDADLVDRFAGDIVLEMRVDLEEAEVEPDPDGESEEQSWSGYAWTSSKGPPMKISAGTLCRGWVTIEEQRPIALVLPKIMGDK